MAPQDLEEISFPSEPDAAAVADAVRAAVFEWVMQRGGTVTVTRGGYSTTFVDGIWPKATAVPLGFVVVVKSKDFGKPPVPGTLGGDPTTNP